MPRDAGVYLEDILTAIGRIRDYTRDLQYSAFLEDAPYDRCRASQP